MKTLTYAELKKWKPCGKWLDKFKDKFGKSAKMSDVETALLKGKHFSELNWIMVKRLKKLNKRKICMFSYRCSNRALKYARKEDLEVLKKAICFAKQFAETGRVDIDAADSAMWSAESAARSAESVEIAMSAARSAMWSARSAMWSANSAAWSANSAASSAWSAASSADSAMWGVEYKWQLKQLNEIEDNKL